jgi:hypothetical protein
MDGSFACPECGFEVEVRGLAPGRQVRCGFCHRLLEVPFLPRAASRSWKRRRPSRPKWFVWAATGLGLLLVAILAAGAFKFLRRQYDSNQDRSIGRLLKSSRDHESEGRLGEALIDLDAALDLAQQAGPAWSARTAQERARRPDLARRDARSILVGLSRNESSPFRVGDWLNLIARAERDPDLAALRTEIEERFQSSLVEQIKRESAGARQLKDAGNMSAAMDACDRSGALLGHLARTAQPEFRREVEALVILLMQTAGITVVVPQGRFVYGSSSYVSDMLPALGKSLEAGGYLPLRESSPWRDLWRHSHYQMRLDVTETQEGNYLSSQNRLTLIHAELALIAGDQEIWKVTPRARSEVPLPKLPAYQATRIAVSTERSEEFERLLYKNARGQIDQKFKAALEGLPPCPGRTVANAR